MEVPKRTSTILDLASFVLERTVDEDGLVKGIFSPGIGASKY